MATRKDASRDIGSITPERGATDRWRLQISLGRDANGRRRRITRIVPGTRRDAEVALARLIVETGNSSNPDESDAARLPFARYLLEQWLGAGTRRRETTQHTLVSVIRTHVTGTQLGDMRLDKITPLVIERWLAGRRAAGVGESRLDKAFSVVRAGLKQAVRWRLIFSDPSAAVEGRPTPAKYRAMKLQVADLQPFLAAFEGSDVEAAVVLALGAGLRRGEAAGLRWQDVDLDGRLVRVERSLGYIGQRLIFGPPKSENGRRKVEIPAWAATRLAAIRRRQLEARMRAGERWRDSGLVLTESDGEPIHPDQITKRFKRRRNAAGLPRARFHDLRHAYASILFSAGESLGVISELMGHYSITITKDLYAQGSRTAHRRAADRLDEVLG
jgi:integrase